ncbi:MAG: M48 family metalloprotease [Oligoflexia bacterium]|nr:M48 family metalloprotease [Oligoflexia bacterium]
MQRLIRLISTALLFASLVACAPQRKLLPPGEIPKPRFVSAADEQYGHEVLSELSQQFELDRDDARVMRVRDVVQRLTSAAKANQDPWHVYVFNDPDFRNAAATRGNYIFVWSAILDDVHDDDELATILAHEIGHVLAGHTEPSPAEETRQMLAGIAGSATGQVIGATGHAGIIADLAEMAVKLSMQALLVNPELQAKELEADQIGLFLMTDAGYDPERAVGFWKRVQDNPNYSGMPLQFLSSHPSSSERYQALEKLMAQAKLRRYSAPSQDKQSHSRAEKVSRLRDDTRQAPRRVLHETWIVVEDSTTVFDAPDSASKPTTRLGAGTRVEVSSQQGDWLKISSPYQGFVKSVDLSPFMQGRDPAGFAE